jgi:hypothetical protein
MIHLYIIQLLNKSIKNGLPNSKESECQNSQIRISSKKIKVFEIMEKVNK